MKLLLITSFLRNKNNKLKRYNYNSKTFNKLFNDYTLRNKKKENMKINYLRNESELYPFSPRLNTRGFISFSPKNMKRNDEEPSFNDFGRTLYYQDKTSFNGKFNHFFNKGNKNARNRINDNEYFKGKGNNFNYNNFSDVDKSNDYIQNDFFGNKNVKPINLKESSYRFPGQKKIIYSKYNKNINKQISEYLNNFENENAKRQNIIKKNNLNGNYLNYNRDSNKHRIGRTNLLINRDRFYNINNKSDNKRKNLFNKSYKKEIDYKNQSERFSFIKNTKSKPIFRIYEDKKIEYKNKNKKNNNKIIYNDSQNYLNNLFQKNKENDLNLKDKNTYSNKSLNPSSLGADQTKTFYTNRQGNSHNNNIKSGNNINSISSRINEPNTHFLTGLKMISGVNECFYDINKFNNNNKNNYRDEFSVQSLSDSKMMELANKYLSDDDNSSENYRMNNVVHSKKKQKNKK